MSTGIIINIRTLLTFLNGGNTEECEMNDAVVCLRGWNHKRKYTIKGNNGEVGLRRYRNTPPSTRTQWNREIKSDHAKHPNTCTMRDVSEAVL